MFGKQRFVKKFIGRKIYNWSGTPCTSTRMCAIHTRYAFIGTTYSRLCVVCEKEGGKESARWGFEGDGKGNSAVSAQMAIGRQEGTPCASPQKTIIINVYDRRASNWNARIKSPYTMGPYDISISGVLRLDYGSSQSSLPLSLPLLFSFFIQVARL